MQGRVVAAAAIVALWLAAPGVSGALCTAPATATEFAAIKTQIAACEAKTGVVMELPLNGAGRKKLCASCPKLAARANAQSLPDCKMEQVTDGRKVVLQKQFEKLFKPCITLAVSDSGSGETTDGAATTTAEPAATPTVKPATAKPATTAAATTAKPVTSKPQTTSTPAGTVKGNANASSSDGADDDGSAEESGASLSSSSKLSDKTQAKKSFADSADWDASGHDAAAHTASSAGKGAVATMEMALGIAGGVLGVVLISSIVVVVLRRRRRAFHPDKHDRSLSLNSSTGESQQMPFQFSISTASTNRANNWGDSSAISTTATTANDWSMARVNIWDDEVIVGARIPKDKVMATTLLSRGGFGEVYRGIYNHQQVAIKTLLPATRKDLKHIEAFFAEVKLMANLEHERIVQFIGVAWDSLNDVCVVSEFMEGGDLKGVLRIFQEQDRPLGFDHTKVKIALHIAHALTYMHSLDPIVLHRDLKSKNILLDTELRAKLTDFGVSRERSDQTMTAAVGTSLWMAPEVMMGERYDDKADVFSFGIVLSELDTHMTPYGEVKESGSGRRIPDSAVLQMIALGRLKVVFSTNAPAEMVRLGNACVALNPRDRPAASEVLYALHRVLKGMYVVI